MKYNICLISNDKSFLERYEKYVNLYYKNDMLLTLCNSEEDYIKLEKVFDGVFVVDEYKEGEEFFSVLGYGEKYRIPKYQKPNEVCTQLMKLCDEVKCNSDLKNKNELLKQSDLYIYKIPCTKNIDRYSYKMITQNVIKGLVPVSKEGDSLIYNIKGKKKLSDFLSGTTTNETKLKVLGQIKNICDNLEGYMLDVEKLSLRTDEIFVDENSLELQLLYCPVSETQQKQETIIMDMGANATFVDNTATEEYGQTAVFDDLQEAARKSIERRSFNNKFND